MSLKKRYEFIFLLLTLLSFSEVRSEKLRIYPDWITDVEMAGMIAAIEKGFYKKAGIELEVVFKDLSIIQRVLDGEADIGMDSSHKLIKAIARGAPLQIFSAKYQITPYCIVVPHDSDIRKMSDFRGRTLGYHVPGDKEIFKVMLGSAGLSLKDVKFEKLHSIKTTGMLKAFKKKKIDGLLAWEFSWSLTLPMEGFRVRVFPGYRNGFQFYGIVYFGKREFIEGNRELLARFLKATFDGWIEVYKAPDHWAKLIVEKWHPKKFYLSTKERTIQQQRLQLLLSKRFLYEGVGESNLGSMSEYKWKRSLAISKKYNFVPASMSLKLGDVYTDSIWKQFRKMK